MMISDKELYERIDQVCEEYHGDIDILCKAVGMMVVGRLFGWRVMRLVTSDRNWKTAIRLFGDPKQLLPDRGPLAHKSVGLKIVDSMGNYWGVIKRTVSRDLVPVDKRRYVA